MDTHGDYPNTPKQDDIFRILFTNINGISTRNLEQPRRCTQSGPSCYGGNEYQLGQQDNIAQGSEHYEEILA